MTDELEELQLAGQKVLKSMECEHRGSEYGNCWDCQNTGYEVTSQEELDLIDLIEKTQTLIKHMKGPSK